MFALGLLSWMYHRPTEGTEAFLRAKFAKKPEIAEANVAAFRAGWNFGETTEDFAVSYEVAPAADGLPDRHLPQHLREPGAVVRADRRGPAGGSAAVPGLVPDHPGLRHPARAVSKHKNFGVRTFQAEDEIAGHRRRAGRGVRRLAGGDDDLRARRGAEVGDDRARGRRWNCRCWSSTSSAAARPPACRPRPSRPTCSRRCTGATARRRCRSWPRATPADCFDAALEAARIALTYRTPVFLLSDGYLANGSRAVADPGRRRTAGPAGAVRHRAQPHAGRRHRGVLAVQARPADAGPPVGGARHARAWSTASAASRSRTAPATSPTTRPTTTSWSAPARPRSTASTSPTWRSTTRPATARHPGPGLGLDVRADHRRGTAACARRGRADRPGPSAPPQPLPAESRRGAAALRQGGRPGDEPRPARHAAAGEVPGRRPRRTPRSAACRSRPSSSPTAHQGGHR